MLEAVSECPPENQLTELAQGRLTDSVATALQAHLRDCSACSRRRMALSDERSDISKTNLVPGKLEHFKGPEVVAEFRLLRLLGQGAMGQVFAAHDTFLDRTVALKFLPTLEASSAARERFYIEARAVARLQHPNVVTLYRASEENGRPYLVSELIRGKSLDQAKKPLASTEVLTIALGIARGLAEAHRHGVLHRDIKPAAIPGGVFRRRCEYLEGLRTCCGQIRGGRFLGWSLPDMEGRSAQAGTYHSRDGWPPETCSYARWAPRWSWTSAAQDWSATISAGHRNRVQRA